MLLHQYVTILAQSQIYSIGLNPSPFLCKVNRSDYVASLTIVKIDAKFSTKNGNAKIWHWIWHKGGEGLAIPDAKLHSFIFLNSGSSEVLGK